MLTMWQGCIVGNEFERPSVRQYPFGETANCETENDKMTVQVKLRFAREEKDGSTLIICR
jgi:hypothetical protein